MVLQANQCTYWHYGRKEKELEATVRKSAEAEAYKLEKIAEGKR